MKIHPSYPANNSQTKINDKQTHIEQFNRRQRVMEVINSSKTAASNNAEVDF